MSAYLDPSETEQALREALSARARQVHPSSRLDAILREAALPERTVDDRRGLLVGGVAAAAAAAVVVGAVWATRPDPDAAPVVPASTATPSPSASSSPPLPVAGPALAVAHYTVGANAGPGSRPCLVRTFGSASWPTDASRSQKVLAAARSLVASSPLWSGVTVDRARVTSSRITLDVTGPGATLDAGRARLALRALAWTAQGQNGAGDVPVTLRVGGGDGLFGHEVPTTLTRAGTPPESVCDIWIDDPAPGRTVAPGSLVARGQAVAYEATVQWELRRGATVVREGFTTASAGAPARGTFEVDLGRLGEGTWTLRAFTTSAEDGKRVVAERLSTFTVQ